MKSLLARGQAVARISGLVLVSCKGILAISFF
jgi:hypothetical protein